MLCGQRSDQGRARLGNRRGPARDVCSGSNRAAFVQRRAAPQLQYHDARAFVTTPRGRTPAGPTMCIPTSPDISTLLSCRTGSSAPLAGPCFDALALPTNNACARTDGPPIPVRKMPVLQTAFVLAVLAASALSQNIDAYVAAEMPIAKAGLLANIGPDGSKAAGAAVRAPHHAADGPCHARAGGRAEPLRCHDPHLHARR